jgi:hypothetical protein
MAGAALLNFDDLMLLPEGSIPITNGYRGFAWNNFFALNTINHIPSGYVAGRISQPNVAYNGGGNPAQLSNVNPFDLYSGYFTGAWNDDLRLEVKGYIGVTLAYDNTYTLSATAPSLLNFDYLGVTSVDFISSGGTPHPGYTGAGTHFAMDNLSVTIVPEPSAVALLMLGMLGWRKLKR